MPNIDFASLASTLSGLTGQTLTDSLAQQQQDELARRTRETAGAAQSAGQEYQQAAAAPPPTGDPNSDFVDTLLGNISSVIAQDPDYRKRAQEGIKAKRAELLQARADNLQAMRDIFGQKAKAAQEAGDMEAAEKARLKLEQLSRAHEEILETQRQGGRLELEAAISANDMEQIEARRVETVRQQRKDDLQEQRRVSGATASIRADVRAEPDIKSFVTIRDQFNMGLRSAQSKSNLGDILLMRAIARASDPLSSVREEEFRTFKGAQGALAQQGINLTKAMWGKGMLSDFGRRQMVGELRKIYAAKKVQYLRAYGMVQARARSEGVPEDNVLRDYASPDEIEDATTPESGAPQGKVMVLNKKGKRFEIDAADLPEAIRRGWTRTQ